MDTGVILVDHALAYVDAQDAFATRRELPGHQTCVKGWQRRRDSNN